MFPCPPGARAYRATRSASGDARAASSGKTRAEGSFFSGLYVLVVNSKVPPLDNPKVKQALSHGVCTAAGFFNCMGCKPQCGKCVPYVRQMVADHRKTMTCASNCDTPEEAAIAAE